MISCFVEIIAANLVALRMSFPLSNGRARLQFHICIKKPVDSSTRGAAKLSILQSSDKFAHAHTTTILFASSSYLIFHPSSSPCSAETPLTFHAGFMTNMHFRMIFPIDFNAIDLHVAQQCQHWFRSTMHMQ